ncbi:MAG: SAM-dependent methyltransferase [Ruminococcus sp.]|nr:SAM-dependent methyltransferase [Ruminococcus sp.]
MDKRLMTCARLCVGKRIADIGTDHGYLPCYMVENGMCETALACDVAQKPLESAREHIQASGLGEKITALISDGLERVPLDGVSDIVIAGMGGELIARILESCAAVASGEKRVNLVLQPMTKWDVLREWLYEHDFEVKREIACEEGRFVYSVMQAEYMGRKPEYRCDLRYKYFGRIKGSDTESKLYLSRQAARLRAAAQGKLAAGEEEQAKKMIALAEAVMAEVSK